MTNFHDCIADAIRSELYDAIQRGDLDSEVLAHLATVAATRAIRTMDQRDVANLIEGAMETTTERSLTGRTSRRVVGPWRTDDYATQPRV